MSAAEQAAPASREAARADGRAARAERTREAVVEAMLGLVREGDLRPTALRIAERAGVSPRSIFQHFDDLESLLALAADRATEQMLRHARPPPADGALTERLAAFIAERSRSLEQGAPVRRAADLVAPFSEAVAARIRWNHERRAAEVARVFAPELAAMPAAVRHELLAALVAAGSWSTWEELRTRQGLSYGAAERVLGRMIAALLAEASGAHEEPEA